MRKHLFIILFTTLASLAAFGKNRVLVNPAYELRNSEILNIIKIEQTDTATRLYVKATFLPNWWITFPKTTYIQPEGSKKTIFATTIENGEFEKRIFMPASGDSLFVLVFPRLDTSVKRINFCCDESFIWNISLTASAKQKVKSEIPASVQLWLNQQLTQAKQKEPLPDYTSDRFFDHSPARLVGYIKGYDPRLGFKTGIIYASNQITREDHPVALIIHPDGRFEATIPMLHPSVFYVSINEQAFTPYLEPGHTLSLIMDWEEFLKANRLRDSRYTFKDIQFGGPLAKINEELMHVNLKLDTWKNKKKYQDSLSPMDYTVYEQKWFQENMELIREKSQEYKLSPKTVTLLNHHAALIYGTSLLDYVDNKVWQSRQDTTKKAQKEPLPDEYYNFIQQMPMNDPGALISTEASTFINRFEFCQPLSQVIRKLFINTPPRKTVIEYLQEEHQDTWTEEDEKMVIIQKKLSEITNNEEQKKYWEANKEVFEAFQKRHKDEIEQYTVKYVNPITKGQQKNREIRKFTLQDSVITNTLHLPLPNLIYDIVKVRSLSSVYKNLSSKDEAEEVLSAAVKDCRFPMVREEAQRIFNQNFPDTEISGYALPATPAGNIFRNIIAPHKGKYIVADFWETWCGPCVAGIRGNKALRDKLKDSKDIAFVFICSEETPENNYEEFVKAQGLENTFRLPKDQYILMRELFKFNGIPHYEYVNRQGEIITKGLDIYNLENSLSKLLEKEQP